MSLPSDRETLAIAFNLFTSLHRVVSDGKHGIMQLEIYRDQIVQSLSALITLPGGVAEGRDLLKRTPPGAITSELLEKVEALVFGPIAREIRTTPFKSTIADARPHDRARVLDLFDRLKTSIREGDTHSAFAFRTLLVAALDQAGAHSIAQEASVLLERASDLLGRAYERVNNPEDVGLRAAIDGWQQDHSPLRKLKTEGITALQTVRTLVANAPLEALTLERLDELHMLLDGHISTGSISSWV